MSIALNQKVLGLEQRVEKLEIILRQLLDSAKLAGAPNMEGIAHLREEMRNEIRAMKARMGKIREAA